MQDDTESIRRTMIATNAPAADLAATTEKTWDTDALRVEFEVLGFMAPFVALVASAVAGRVRAWRNAAPIDDGLWAE